MISAPNFLDFASTRLSDGNTTLPTFQNSSMYMNFLNIQDRDDRSNGESNAIPVQRCLFEKLIAFTILFPWISFYARGTDEQRCTRSTKPLSVDSSVFYQGHWSIPWCGHDQSSQISYDQLICRLGMFMQTESVPLLNSGVRAWWRTVSTVFSNARHA